MTATGNTCCCSDSHPTYIDGLGPVPSYTGEFPSPLRLMFYVPKDMNELFKFQYPASEIRSWVRQASNYHEVPYELAAVILQQENGPNATSTQKFFQFGERSLTTLAAIIDEWMFDVVPDKVAGSSSGIANMSRRTLRDAATYIESTYCRPVLPDDVRTRLLGWNQDTRIQGDDLKADLYYMTAHLRQLIDRVAGQGASGKCHTGALTLEQVGKVAAAYNGSGPKAVKYGEDTLKRLRNAVSGQEPLYFHELP
jgi:hypothetical protein